VEELMKRAVLLLLLFAITACARATTSRPKALGVEDVLNWRSEISDFLGKDPVLVRERFKSSLKEKDGVLGVTLKSGRDASFSVKDGVVSDAKVYPEPGEDLPLAAVVLRGDVFDFEDGVFENSSERYFAAVTQDGRQVGIQFKVTREEVTFQRVVFSSTAIPRK
jgi:hypothetical protein